jgi:hypothetical protein
MRYLNFLLIASVLFCYVGISPQIHHSFVLPSMDSHHTTHHENHKQEAYTGHSIAGSHESVNAEEKEAVRCCNYMLPNAPHSYDFDLESSFLYLVPADMPTLEVNKVSSSHPSSTLKKGYCPPDLFLTNSTFLL